MFVVAVCVILATTQSAAAALITQILSPSGFISNKQIVEDFEGGTALAQPADTDLFAFENTARVGMASLWTGGNTSSGNKGLLEDSTDQPLEIEFKKPVNEVGMYFGNDDFGRIFYANLELFDAAKTSLGKVQVKSNGNDFADQYIGARSSVPVRWARIYYDQPNAQTLFAYIDDLRVGTVVPEPSVVGLAAVGTCFLSAARGILRPIRGRRRTNRVRQ